MSTAMTGQYNFQRVKVHARPSREADWNFWGRLWRREVLPSKWNQENHFDLDVVDPDNQGKPDRVLRQRAVVLLEWIVSDDLSKSYR